MKSGDRPASDPQTGESAAEAKPGAPDRIAGDKPPNPDKRNSNAIEWIKAVGMPVVTLMVTVLGGYFFTNLTKDREARESNERLYAQLLTSREQSDAAIRKDMFGVVINSFLTANKTSETRNVVSDLEDRVLKIELLANNFSETLDLAPLFKDLARKAVDAAPPAVAGGADRKRLDELSKRLDLTAANLIFRQVQSLSRHGLASSYTGSLEALGDWQGDPALKVIIKETIAKQRLVPSTEERPVGPTEQLGFSVEVLEVHFERREVDIRFRVFVPGSGRDIVDRAFTVGPYDFPMLDNTQLPDGLRAAVVMTEFNMPNRPATTNSFATLHLVVFPAASASYKERQDYDEILLGMLRAQSQGKNK